MSYIIMRFNSGEQVMATLDAEDHTHLHVAYPMVVKTERYIDGGQIKEHVTAQPLCSFSTDKYYDIPKSSVMFVKQLHQMLVPHYLRIVESYEQTVLVTPQQDGGLQWEDEEESHMDSNDFRKRIDALADFLGNEKQEDDSIEPTIVEGNDTIH